MVNHHKKAAGVWAVLFLWALSCPLAVFGSNPSLCLSETTGCDQPGSTVNIQVLLGAGDPKIVGVQFKLTYDPEALSAIEVRPGHSCDATSPFSLEIYEEIDNANGTLFYAVGIDVFSGGEGQNDAATIACIRFLPQGVSLSDISILVGEEPRATRLSDDMGHLVLPDNSTSCPAATPDVLAHQAALVKDVCRCEEDSDCVPLDGPCCEGKCDASSLLCKIMPINEGGACDDGNDCTTTDLCANGVCSGSGCTNPSLCIGEICTPPESLMTVPIHLGAGVPIIIGGQFTVQWDTTGLELVEAEPGNACDPNSPFALEIHSVVNESEGELFYAVGIPPEGEGTNEATTLACLFFRVLDSEYSEFCLYEDINPFRTKLVDENGQFVNINNDGVCSSDMGYPYIQCESSGFCEIPTTSEWGLVVLTLAFLIGAKLRFASCTVTP